MIFNIICKILICFLTSIMLVFYIWNLFPLSEKYYNQITFIILYTVRIIVAIVLILSCITIICLVS